MPANRLITLAMTSVQMSPLAPPRAICAIRTMPASGASVSAVPVAASAAASIRRARMGARPSGSGREGLGRPRPRHERSWNRGIQEYGIGGFPARSPPRLGWDRHGNADVNENLN